jgi:uncharacterized protein YbbC (DUF1343 family)
VLDRHAFKPVLTGAAVIEEMRAADPASFAWKPPPYEYEHDKQPIDVIAGAKWFREMVDAGEPAEAIADQWQSGLAAFRDLRQPYLLY